MTLFLSFLDFLFSVIGWLFLSLTLFFFLWMIFFLYINSWLSCSMKLWQDKEFFSFFVFCFFLFSFFCWVFFLSWVYYFFSFFDFIFFFFLANSFFLSDFSQFILQPSSGLIFVLTIQSSLSFVPCCPGALVVLQCVFLFIFFIQKKNGY